MSTETLLFVILAFLGWGIGAFLSKLAANRIGTQSIFWDLLGYIPMILIYSMFAFKLKNLFSLIQTDKTGIILAFLAGLIGSIGVISFYYLMTKSEASVVTPLTALYPALTVVLGIIILHEGITVSKITGIILSLVAIFLLSR